MSIFVLNLATLLGLGLGVDYALLLTSRFREELAPRRRRPAAGRLGRPGGGRRGGRGHRRDGRAGGLLQRPDRAARPDRACCSSSSWSCARSASPGAIVVGLAVAGGADAAAGRPGHRSGRGSTGVAGRLRPRAAGPASADAASSARRARRSRRVLGAAGRAGHGPSRGASSCPRWACCCCSALPFLHVRFNAPDAIDPAARRAVAPGLRHPRPRVRRGRVRAAHPGRARPTARPPTRPTSALLYDYAGAWPPTRASAAWTRIVDVDPRLSQAQYQLLYGSPAGVPRPLRGDGPGGARRSGDLTAVTLTTPYGPNAPEGRALVEDLRDPTVALAPPAGPDRARRRRRGRGDRRRRPHRGRLPAHGPVHPRDHLPRPVPAAALGRAAAQGAGHEQPLDPGQLRRAGLDLPGRQPLGAARLRAARLRRDDAAGHPVLRPVRPVDGLRGLPALAHEGGLRPDRRQPRGGRARAWSGAGAS